MNENERPASGIQLLPTASGTLVPVPGEGAAQFADTADRPTTTYKAKLPDGTTHDVIPQSGTATLEAGTTALISATITTSSRIFLTVKTPGTPTLTTEYAALASDRVAGLSSASGGFKITALVAAGTINVDDTSVLDWLVIN